MAERPPGSARHFLGDLGVDGKTDCEGLCIARIQVNTAKCNARGEVRAGVLATLVDVVGGVLAARELYPDWMATADLALRIIRPARGPVVEARASVLRRGRATLVVEAFVYDVDDRNQYVRGDADAGHGHGAKSISSPHSERRVAWASMTFAVLASGGAEGPSDSRFPGNDTSDSDHSGGTSLSDYLFGRTWSMNGPGFDVPVTDGVGITISDPAGGVASVEVNEYVQNSIGALQGGVMALLAETAAEQAVASAVGGEAEVRITDLQMAYLALGRIGPIESRVTVLEGDGIGERCLFPPAGRQSALVELHDRGDDDRLTTVVTVGTSSSASDSIAESGDAGLVTELGPLRKTGAS
ncbi:MAG: hotdog fold thioesterase [Acidimicrobiales bacterium]